MDMPIQEQSKASKEMLKKLFEQGFDPREALGVCLNASLMLAAMTEADCAYVNSVEYSILLSETGRETEALGFIHEVQAQAIADKQNEPRKPTEDGNNVFSINPTK